MTRARRRLPFLAAVLVAGLTVPVALPAVAVGADRQSEIDAELRRLKDQVGEATEAEAELVAELRVTQRRRRELDAKVSTLVASIANAAQDVAEINAAVTRAEAAQAAAEAALLAARFQLDESTDVLQEQAVQAFMRFGKDRPRVLKAMASVEDVTEAPRVVALADAVAEHQALVVEGHRQLQEDTTRLEETATAAKAATAAERDRVVARQRQLESDKVEVEQAQVEAHAEAAEEERLLAKNRANQAKDEGRISQLQKESSEIAALLRRRQQGTRATPSGKGVLAYPLEDPVITSTFGYRTHPIYGDIRLHAGVDFRGATGTPILAAADGVVLYAGVKSGYGNTVIIDHGGLLATLYAHQSSMAVATGASVSRGQVIGAVGATGLATGPHLHFEVRVDGTPVDPLAYL